MLESSDSKRTATFSEVQRSTLEALTARLIPGNEDDPGAREANVSEYILRALAFDYEGWVKAYSAGLDSLDAFSLDLHGLDFKALIEDQQDAVLKAIEDKPATDELRRFFELVLRHTLEGMFGDPDWGGNANYAGWRLLGYPGPRFEWLSSEQQIDVFIDARYRIEPGAARGEKA